jgi:hypothetical protein
MPFVCGDMAFFGVHESKTIDHDRIHFYYVEDEALLMGFLL